MELTVTTNQDTETPSTAAQKVLGHSPANYSKAYDMSKFYLHVQHQSYKNNESSPGIVVLDQCQQ